MRKIVGLLFVALLGGSFLLTGCNQGKKIYLQLYSLRDDIKADYPSTITQVADMGYSGVEAAGYNDGRFYDLSPADFKKSIDDAGLEMLSSHAGRPLADSTQNSDWNEIWAWWDTAIQAHKEAGMKYLVVPWIPTPKTLVDLQAYCDYFNQVGEKCNAAGIRFGYHNHNFEFNEIEGELMYDYLLNHTDPAKVFFQMDVYWVVEGGKDPVDYFNNYPGRFEVIHIKDETELGKSGKVDFESIFNNIDRSGAKYLVVEVEKYSGTPLEGVRESFDFLNSADFVKPSYAN